ncbi:LCI fold-containing protein [Bacillus cereus group sp. BfR-BA-01453]|uniref:LCI fold-containing protein n=1 Tax=Bacillus cereus group sp. BfR-BA-01453 TaxID=2920355 RepID=UPI001F586640|nr:LCI fold-containing protein [Bacillus cereus group sp. BfR-BA-01453]
MFKKLVVGTLATGIMLSGAGGAMAATPNTDSAKTDKVTMAAEKKYIKIGGYATIDDVPNVTVLYGIKWYLKKATQEDDGTWTGHFEGWY